MRWKSGWQTVGDGMGKREGEEAFDFERWDGFAGAVIL